MVGKLLIYCFDRFTLTINCLRMWVSPKSSRLKPIILSCFCFTGVDSNKRELRSLLLLFVLSLTKGLPMSKQQIIKPGTAANHKSVSKVFV